jgi:hypothetical protein
VVATGAAGEADVEARTRPTVNMTNSKAGSSARIKVARDAALSGKLILNRNLNMA